MAKSALLRGRSVKVENRSSFDKSFLNLLTTNVGTITPILKQLVIPSSGKVRIPVHVELPPLATDAYLRSHLKLEAFYCPLRLCYGGFQSWFAGEPVWDGETEFTRAELPRVFVPSEFATTIEGQDAVFHFDPDDEFNMFGQGSLLDYFDARFPIKEDEQGPSVGVPTLDNLDLSSDTEASGLFLNIFPFLCYHLIYDHFYRNKSVSKPGFTPSVRGNGDVAYGLVHDLPFSAYDHIVSVVFGSYEDISSPGQSDTHPYQLFNGQQGYVSNDALLNGHYLWELRQRNFGDDYFTAARPSAQAGSPVTVQVDGSGKFTIASLRAQNAFQEFSEVNSYATPDYVQTNAARYGVSPSDAIVQKPVLLGSADFPIFTKAVELNSQTAGDATSYGSVRNPFSDAGIVGSKAGVASGNGTFEFDFDVKEPGYIMVMATLVPEACYSTGVSKDMRCFIDVGSLVDLPVGLLEHVGDEPVFENELAVEDSSSFSRVFGYVQRYLSHKVGNVNQVHGLFRDGMSLEAFSVQREFSDPVQISSDFLEVPKTSLDGVAAVANGISDFGVMLDCAIEMFVSEPLSESALPALSNPASEHGRSVYVQNGGSKLA